MNHSEDEASNHYLPLEYWLMDELGERSGKELTVENDDANHLYIAAEKSFDDAIPLILEELAANRSTNLRESAIFLLDCYAEPRFADAVLKSLRMEHTYTEQAEEGIYVNALLTFGEVMIKPMLAIWRDSQADSYSKSVAGDYLTRFLGKPLVEE